MIKRLSRRGRLSLVGALTVALIGFTPTSASATPDASVERLAGLDRYATAITISRDTWANQQAQAVVLARGEQFPDALAGTPLAVAKRGPLLLTPPSSLSPTASNEIKRVLPTGGTVYLLGGTAALSENVATGVKNLGYRPVRLAGGDRYATATAIARQIPSPSTIFEATGLTFVYALPAGVAAAKVGGVVVLTANDKMPAPTKTYLDQHPGVPRVAVGPEASTADPGATSVVAADRYQTSRLLAERYFEGATTVGVASGTDYADALSGGAHIGKAGGPLLLSAPNDLPDTIQTYLSQNASTISRAYLYGGPKALATQVEDEVQNTIRGATFFGDGTHRVGEDVPAGTYRLRRDPEFCYWERTSGFSGSWDEINANDITDDHTVVTIDPADAGFKSDDCGTWTSDLSALTESPTAPFADGTWIVGTDIAPGTWTAPGGDGCYWARLADFKGEIDSIKANDFDTTGPIVTIDEADAGFESNDCGQWTQTG